MPHLAAAVLALLAACRFLPEPSGGTGDAPGCVSVKDDDWGPVGTVPVAAQTVVSGLEVPWGIAFLPGGDMLVTERPGRVRLIHAGKLVPAPVATVQVSRATEGGLLGIAVHPADPSLVYLYTTQDQGNRIERWKLAADHRSMKLDRAIFTGIATAAFHDGGRLRFGPDGMLYAGTGDARKPDSAQDAASPNGKLLRLTPEGRPAPGNPVASSPALLSGIRNTQGFDWLDKDTLVVADHGPSGEMLRYAHDEINLARAGDNLGWPVIYGCDAKQGLVTPLMTWEKNAMPPGGLAVYRGDAIAAWKGSVLVGTLASEHLHRFVLDKGRVQRHETYFLRQLGRLREVVMGPDGELYLTTSNCDGRGECPAGKDRILRVTPR